MRDFNKAIIMGNLTRDPEIRTTTTGQQVASFAIATNRRWNDANGNQQEETEFHDIVAWGKLAEICEQILHKGRKVLIEGRLKTRNWEGQDGVKRYKTEIIAENIAATGPGRNQADGAEVNDFPADEKQTNSADSKPAPSVKTKSTPDKTNDKKQEKSQDEQDLEDILGDVPF